MLAFLLALGIRLLNLGDGPLSEFEAGWALQSWSAAQGGAVNIGPNPGYFSLTSLLFFILESTNTLARFWPALVGSLLVLTPYGFRNLLGRKTALVLAFGLALDPGLVALSRLAGGPMLAIGFGVLALVFIHHKKSVGAGIFSGLALISGPSGITGLLGFGIAYGVARLTGIPLGSGNSDESESPQNQPRTSPEDLRLGVIFGAVTILLVSTLLLHFPQGIGAWASSLPAYLQGWITFSGVPVFQPLLALVFYQPLAVIFGLVAVGRGWIVADKISRGLSLWLAAAVLLPMLSPGRQVLDVAWALLPLWALAGRELQRYLDIPWPRAAAFGQAAVVFVLAVLLWMVGLRLPAEGPAWLIMAIVPALIVLTTILVGLGWSHPAAQSGLVWGLSAALGAYGISAMVGVSQLRPNSPQELWTPPPAPGQADLLVATLEELALIQNGRSDSLDIVELVMEFEDNFDMSIPDEEAEKIKTVGQVIDYIATSQQDK